MNYEVGNDLISQGYAMRTDARGKIHVGTLENLLERFAEPRYWAKINNALFAKGTHHTIASVTFDLIAWTWKEPEANRIAWRVFLDKAANGIARWVAKDGVYSTAELTDEATILE